MVTSYRFPRGQHTGGTCTSDVVESPFAALRLRIDVAKRFKRWPTPPQWGRCCWSPNRSSGASIRLSYCRP